MAVGNAARVIEMSDWQGERTVVLLGPAEPVVFVARQDTPEKQRQLVDAALKAAKSEVISRL